MSPRIDISGVKAACQKCALDIPDRLFRHHTGSQLMFVRQFRARYRTKRYQEFKERYYSFHSDDIVILCDNCHELVHKLYRPIIGRHLRRVGYVPMCRWTWEQAEILMRDLDRFCREWIKLRKTA